MAPRETFPPNPLPPTVLSPAQEILFQKQYAQVARIHGIDPNPDDPEHYYDYRAAWLAGLLNTHGASHFDSRFKLPGHPRYYMGPMGTFSPYPLPGWINTVTGQVVPGAGRPGP